jgi:hypothetical protein
MGIRRHLAYLRYIARHKFYVLVAGRHLGVPLWLLLVHDASKFSRAEWFPYAATFYNPDGSRTYTPTAAFDVAWLHHQHANKHHWQHWLLLNDNRSAATLRMPSRYVLEMVADWAGAGRAITGRWELAEWYAKNRDKITLHADTRAAVEALLHEKFPEVRP